MSDGGGDGNLTSEGDGEEEGLTRKSVMPSFLGKKREVETLNMKSQIEHIPHSKAGTHIFYYLNLTLFSDGTVMVRQGIAFFLT